MIVGAGFGGLAAAIELRRHGFTDVTVLERAPGVGGTWHYNDYPGCACDVPSHLYSFSFAQRRHWSRLCSPQPEILRLPRGGGARRTASTGSSRPASTSVSCRWEGTLARGPSRPPTGERWSADARRDRDRAAPPAGDPAVQGVDEFAGHSFHSARWDHDYDLAGKRVAVIGTGASAVQFVPEIAEQAGRLYVFQRTGNWFLPRRNRAYPAAGAGVIRYVPGVQALRRRFIYYYAETLTMMIRNPRRSGGSGGCGRRCSCAGSCATPRCGARPGPTTRSGASGSCSARATCRRSQRPNVELVTEPIDRFTRRPGS